MRPRAVRWRRRCNVHALAHVAFVFPGQGSQAVGMGATCCDAFAGRARARSAEADDALGFPLSRIIREGPEAELRRTANTQPAILLVSVAAYRALELEPAAVAGHSLGEYSALVAAGALDVPRRHRAGAQARALHAGGGARRSRAPCWR